MSFDPGAGLDPGQVRDVRGRTGRGGTLALGGGGLGLLVVIAVILLGGDPGALLGGGTGAAPVTGPESSTLQEECRTGQDANERADCRIVGYVNSVQEYWDGAFADAGSSYRRAPTVLYTDFVQTACGGATSQVGPFYCPPDGSVYLDLGFFDQLQAQFGARGGRFAEAYVVAHEYGHHVQDLLGLLDQAAGATGEDSGAVRTELMADCLAGVWAGNAEATKVIADVSRTDITDALDAAAAVGDDRIQARVQEQVNPESWTHGSSEQRQRWFTAGYESGDMGSCDTFGVAQP
jgi:uncharacterized protein